MSLPQQPSRRRARRTRRRQANGRPDEVAQVVGSVAYQATTVVTAANQLRILLDPGQSSPSMGTIVPRLGAIADNYELYRYRHLKLSFLQSGTGAAEMGYAAYQAGDAKDVTTIAAASESEKFVMAHPGQTTPAVLNLTPGDLRGDKPWYDIANDGEKPGAILLGTYAVATGLATADTLFVRIDYHVELKYPSDDSIALRRAIAKAKFTRQVLAVLDETEHADDETSVPPVTPRGEYQMVPESTAWRRRPRPPK